MGFAAKQRKIVLDHSDAVLRGDHMVVAPAEVRHRGGGIRRLYPSLFLVKFWFLLLIVDEEEREKDCRILYTNMRGSSTFLVPEMHNTATTSSPLYHRGGFSL
jgi:hypothetical protein